ncbi:hypothetical protein J4405_05655 [Candidatus Woesearchaeota archaeon]|nr:hypothetical protein [Candidatus Woesearchaeota archaeon]
MLDKDDQKKSTLYHVAIYYSQDPMILTFVDRKSYVVWRKSQSLPLRIEENVTPDFVERRKRCSSLSDRLPCTTKITIKPYLPEIKQDL